MYDVVHQAVGCFSRGLLGGAQQSPASFSVSGAVTCRQQRSDPRAVITDIPDAEVQRGLYELVTRGLLPKTLDATAAFEGDVLALTGTPTLLLVMAIRVCTDRYCNTATFTAMRACIDRYCK